MAERPLTLKKITKICEKCTFVSVSDINSTNSISIQPINEKWYSSLYKPQNNK